MALDTQKRGATYTLVLCALFAALSCVGAFIKIPFIPLPITLQTLFTTMAGLLLGGKRGAISIGVYIALGLLGLPVFTQGGGLGYFLKPSFGFILGFAAGAFVTGLIASRKENPSFLWLLGACFAGMGVIYLIGLPYFYVITNQFTENTIGISALMVNCFLMMLPGDIAKNLVAAFLAKRLWRIRPR